jgi:uncharacterized repeat protein (TIGR03803 family)
VTNRGYVMTFMVVLMLAALAQAQTLTSIFNFDNSDGGYPYTGRLAIDRTTGTLYGTAAYGGDLNCGAGYGCGVVYKLDSAGTETVLHNFTGGSDGASPYAGLIRDSKGNLYGTANNGGDVACNTPYGCGVVFKVDTAGNETVLHIFSGGTSDGCYPQQGLVKDKKGSLYGTTMYCGSSSEGTIFKIDTVGSETILHSFAGGSSDGANPYLGSMRINKKGNLYGVTANGGGSGCGYGCGVLYELSKSGTYAVLHNFAGGTSDGCLPYGTPARDGKGNLYGTTQACGANSYYGTVWKVSSSGTETILHSFNYNTPDGAYPAEGVALDKKGNLYGLDEGGTDSAGVLYELSSSGTFTILHSFDGSDGGNPVGDEVLIGIKGRLYGATGDGGSGNYGTVWKYVP